MTAAAAAGPLPAPPAALGAALCRRLRRAVADGGDLLRRFTDADGWVTLGALFLDRRFRREAATASGDDAAPAAAFPLLVAAAQASVELEVSDSPRTRVRLAPPAGASGAAAAAGRAGRAGPEAQAPPQQDGGAAGAGGVARNVKGELQAFMCRRLGRPIAKQEMAFTVRKLSEQPPSFEAVVEVWGETYSGAPQPQKKAAEHAAAQVALEALQAKDGSAGDPQTGDRQAAAEHAAAREACEEEGTGSHGTAEEGVDYKGQLLHWFQVRGINGAGAAHFEVDRSDPDDKVFRCRVVADCLGGRGFWGLPQARDAHGSSAKARRAAEQDAARVALRALEQEEWGEQLQPPREPRREAHARVLRLPPGPAALPLPERLCVEADDFLEAAARALRCRDVLPHPLQWAGDRPRGLCLFEAAPSGPAPPEPNPRASLLAGVPVAGAALLMDASAHSGGAVLRDVTGARYEALKAERSGGSRGPVAILNASRGMQIAGHPELPLAHEVDRWVGVNPKTLLNEALRAQGILEAAQYEVWADGGGGLFRASAAVRARGAGVVEASAPAPRRSKADAQQAAALALLHALVESGAVGGEAAAPASSPGRPLGAEALRALADCEALRSGPGEPPRAGAPLTLDYSISVAGPLGSVGTAAGAEPRSLVVEECSRVQTAVGARVLSPLLELAAARSARGASAAFHAQCSYEGMPCRVSLDLTVHEGAPPPGGEAPAAAATTCGGAQHVFDPPLWRQRISFIVEALRSHSVKSALDLGCGDGHLLEALLAAGIGHVIGVDHSDKRVKSARRRAEAAEGLCCEDQVCEVIAADFLASDAPRFHVDAIVLSEVVEHVPNSQMPRVVDALFGTRPRLAIITTPNAEFGSAGADARGCTRHPDHEREWTREEFRQWASEVAATHGYDLMAPQGVGEVPEQQAQGPCTQIAVFLRASGAGAGLGGGGGPLPGPVPAAVAAAAAGLEARQEEQPSEEESPAVDSAAGRADPIADVRGLARSALRSEELVVGRGLWKFVHVEGSGDVPPTHSRITVHYASYRSDGQCVDASRGGRRVAPSVFQLGGTTVLEAWQRAVATMRRGEVSWVESPPAFAFGELGAPPRIPAGENMWFMLELVDFRRPGTLHRFRDFSSAMEEAGRHLDMGRGDLQRRAFVQARQAFRRALDAVPEKLLLGRPREDVARFAALERSSLLNQALCAQRLGEAAAEAMEADGRRHWEEAVRVCGVLLRRHWPEEGGAGAGTAAAEVPRDGSALTAALHVASAAAGPLHWAAKALFRRGLAREHLGYLSDAAEDLAAALRLEPGDAAVRERLDALRQRLARTALRPERMFSAVLEREREVRERCEAAAVLEEKRRRREARLQRQVERGGPGAAGAPP